MKLFLVLALCLATLYVSSAQHLPEVLIAKARELIDVAEGELHKHHTNGLQHLTKTLELEIEEVRKLERQLLSLEKERHMEISEVAEVEERLLHHENRLIEALVILMHENAKERERKREEEIINA